MICMCEFEDGQKIRTIRCLHIFHTECIDKWLTTRTGTCPICKIKQKAPLNKQEVAQMMTNKLMKNVDRAQRRQDEEDRELSKM